MVMLSSMVILCRFGFNSNNARMKEGLSRQEAAERLQKYGYNEWNISRRPSAWQTLKEVMSEPMFLLLLACGVLYVLVAGAVAVGGYPES